MCTRCNACLNGLVSYCEMFICDGEACKFWTFEGPTQRVIQRWFDDATVHHSSLCPSMHLAWYSAGSTSDPEAWPGQSWEPHVCRMWGNSLSISQMQTPIPLEDAPLSLSLQIIFFLFFFFCHAQHFFLLCQAFFRIHHLPFPIFISPFWPWRLQSLALTTLWHMSLTAVEWKVLSGWGWTCGRAGWVDLSPGYWIDDMVWGTSQPRLSLEVSCVHSSHPAAVLCFVSWSQMK